MNKKKGSIKEWEYRRELSRLELDLDMLQSVVNNRIKRIRKRIEKIEGYGEKKE